MIYEIVVDAGETANKCTIAPLATRSDFRLYRVRGEGHLGPLSAPILLHHEGQCLSELRFALPKVSALASIDCVWRRLPKLLKRVKWVDEKTPVLVKIPRGFQTAYPRVGTAATDPDGGLATIEALFIAAALFGNFDTSLLSKYYFARLFLERNLERFLELGVGEAEKLDVFPPRPHVNRNAHTRRCDRGRNG